MNTLIQNRWTILIPLTGFSSDYAVWGAWALLFGWHDRTSDISLTYWIGDHGPLPFFSAFALYIVWRTKRHTPRFLFAGVFLLLPVFAALLMVYEPDSSQLRPPVMHILRGQFQELNPVQFVNAHKVPGFLIWLHLAYMIVKTTSVAFMLAVYPFFVRRWTRPLRVAMLGAYLAIASFAVLIIADGDAAELRTGVKLTALCLVLGALIVFAADWKFQIVQAARRRAAVMGIRRAAALRRKQSVLSQPPPA